MSTATKNKLQTLIIKALLLYQNTWQFHVLLAPSVHFCPSASVYYGKWEFIIWICSVPTLETKFPQLPVCHMCIPAYKAFVWLFSGSCCICDGAIHNGHRSNDCYSSNWTPRWQNVFRHNICSRSTQRLLRESWRCTRSFQQNCQLVVRLAI